MLHAVFGGKSGDPASSLGVEIVVVRGLTRRGLLVHGGTINGLRSGLLHTYTCSCEARVTNVCALIRVDMYTGSNTIRNALANAIMHVDWRSA